MRKVKWTCIHSPYQSCSLDRSSCKSEHHYHLEEGGVSKSTPPVETEPSSKNVSLHHLGRQGAQKTASLPILEAMMVGTENLLLRHLAKSCQSDNLLMRHWKMPRNWQLHLSHTTTNIGLISHGGILKQPRSHVR